MRSVTILLLAFVLGGVLVWLLLRDDAIEIDPALPLTPNAEDERAGNRHLWVRTGNLVIRARAPNGSVPFGTEVGYRFRGETHLLYASADGTRGFADAPLGDLIAIARAPGYEEASQPREILPGVPVEVRLTLRRPADN